MITPQFVGQRYKDTNTGNIWIANSTTPGDWTLEVQNMQVKWAPNTLKLGQLIAFVCGTNVNPPIPGITSLVFGQTDLTEIIDIEGSGDLISISFPNLLHAPCGAFSILTIAFNTALTTISAPLAIDIGDISIQSCNVLTTADFSSLASNTGDFTLKDCPLLTSISVAASFTPHDGQFLTFTGNSLNQACVDFMLARCVANPAYASGGVRLNGGTNSPPSNPAGLADKATLNARAPGLAVTN